MKYVITYGGLGDCVMLCEAIRRHHIVHVFTNSKNAELIRALELDCRITICNFVVNETLLSKIILFLHVGIVALIIFCTKNASRVGVCTFSRVYGGLSFNRILTLDESLKSSSRAKCYSEFMEKL